MKDNAVIFLKDWNLLVSSLTAENQLYFWDLFINYEYGKNQECTNDFVKPIWNFIKSQMDNMKERYNEKTVSKNRINGAKGGRPKKEPNETKQDKNNPNNPLGFLETQITPKNNEKNNEKDNEKDNNILLEKESKGSGDLNQKKSNDGKELFDTKQKWKKELLRRGADEIHINDWFKTRDKARSAYTDTAFKHFLNECDRNVYPVKDAVFKCALKGWRGFKFEWINKNENEKSNTNTSNSSSGKGFRPDDIDKRRVSEKIAESFANGDFL